MLDTIYIEEAIVDHPRVEHIRARFSKAKVVICAHYGEIFNRKAQNFRLQKKRPSLILAEKQGKFVLKAPSGYGIGSKNNYYFSHMLNCPYDCRYCFLQGMYPSANYVLFVNYEGFYEEIESLAKAHQGDECHFFSGYDCDSLAYDPVSGFVKAFLPFFRRQPQALLELRTKSTQIRSLISQKPFDNCVIAYSFTPQELLNLENKVPAVEKRIAAMQRLQNEGWLLGLRLDPLIYHENFRDNYRHLLKALFTKVDATKLHSVSMGTFRLPEAFFQKMWKLYPDEAFFAGPLVLNSTNKMMSYSMELEQEMSGFCEEELLKYINRHQYFPCTI